MFRIESIVGHLSQQVMADRLHHLEHHGTIEFLIISEEDLDRRRLVCKTDKGNDIAIALPRDQKLTDGAVLFLDAGKAIVVRGAVQRWLAISPRNAEDALELGYHAGNLHWRIKFEGGVLLVALNGPAADYLSRIADMVDAGRVVVREITI